MNMTKEELSKRIASLYQVQSHFVESIVTGEQSEWLIDDTARMFELAVENDIWIKHMSEHVKCEYGAGDWNIREVYNDHPTMLEATLYAIGLALVKKKEMA